MLNIDKLKNIYQKTQKPLAFFLFFVVAADHYNPFVELRLSALLALGVIIMTTLFSIDSKLLTKSNPQTFKNLHSAQPEMQKLIEYYVSEGDLTLQWIGTSMDRGWPFLRNVLNEILRRNITTHITVEVYMVSEKLEGLGSLNSNWPSDVPVNSSQINKWKDMLTEKNPDKISILFLQYQCIPYVTGLLINGKHLFLGYCSCQSEGLHEELNYSVGSNPYHFFEDDHERGTDAIRQFQHLIDLYKRLDAHQNKS